MSSTIKKATLTGGKLLCGGFLCPPEGILRPGAGWRYAVRDGFLRLAKDHILLKSPGLPRGFSVLCIIVPHSRGNREISDQNF